MVTNVRTTTVTDALSHVTTYAFDINSQRMTEVADALARATAMTYDGEGRMTRLTRPEGDATVIKYDDRGNVTEQRSAAKTGSSAPDIVVRADYPETCGNALTCNQPTATYSPVYDVAGAQGNRTDYTYDLTHGGVTSVAAPAASPGGVQPQTRYSYTAYQAFYRDNVDNIVASGTSIDKLTGVSACRTQASCVGTADEVISTTSYGPQSAGIGNNLLPVSTSAGAGDGSLNALTVYGYDDIGNVVSVDGPLPGTADTSVLRYDAARQRVGTIAPDPDGGGALPNRATRLNYDAKGRVTFAESGTTLGQGDAAWASFAPAQAVASSYSGTDQVLSQALRSGGTTYALTEFSYDAADRLVCTKQRMTLAARPSSRTSCSRKARRSAVARCSLTRIAARKFTCALRAARISASETGSRQGSRR